MCLPSSITRDRDARSDVTLENCHIIKFEFSADHGSIERVNVWRHEPFILRPLRNVDRIRDVRPGDVVLLDGRRRRVRRVIVYR